MELEMSEDRQQRASTVSSGSFNLGDATDDSIRVKHGSSTPPTSLSSGPSDIADANKDEPPLDQRRSSRARHSVGSYNLQVLAGTNIHTPLRYLRMQAEAAEATPKAPEVPPPVQDYTSTDDKVLASSLGDYWKLDTSPRPRPASSQVNTVSTDTSDKNLRRTSSRLDLVKEATTNAVAAATSATSKTIGSRTNAVRPSTKPQTRPSLSEKADAAPRTPTKRARAATTESPATATAATTPEPTPKPATQAKKQKYRIVSEGIYIGQRADPEKDYSDKNARAKKSKAGETPQPPRKGSDWFPLPMFHGAKVIMQERDFKLPREILNPLPRGERVEGWKILSKNRAVDDDSREAYQRLCTRKKQEAISMCECQELCDPDSCLNAVMNFECDDKNCKPGKDNCNNRPFAGLEARVSTQGRRGNMYDIGVEVVKTQDRGYGVRAMRSFRPGQIIMEYTGEMIDQTECDRRMRKEYKNNECYYLMTFDGGLIIDATKGSMARFVNHSCDPNCEMIMWLVRGKPRMALFAKDGHIPAGHELTYDYNFEAFSEGWKQDCRCGADNCRGILGPRPRDGARLKDMVTKVAKVAKGVKRTAQAAFEGMASLGGVATKKQRGNKDTHTETKSVTSKISKKALMAPAVAADAISPKKASQSASREARATARHAEEVKQRARRQDASRNEATRRAEIVKKAAEKKKAAARKRLTSSRAMKPTKEPSKAVEPKAAQSKTLKKTKAEKTASKPAKSASQPVIKSGVASKAYEKKREKLTMTTNLTAGTRLSPRQKKISNFFKALNILRNTESEDEEEDFVMSDTDDDEPTPGSDKTANELAEQLQNEIRALPVLKTSKTAARKNTANPAIKKRTYIKKVKMIHSRLPKSTKVMKTAKTAKTGKVSKANVRPSNIMRPH
ncbi:hypothetical protein EJ05DRAFT_453102 [Pseudovirgaria hyperparasitica]|uniref:SET domain-containing protein n=1 Tax=Pseudovirgaria hyperparasitica TaxID=470096 RepID=A0A6A6W6Y2_9PEZI|nr:uncharacterized protein EJ05DRAFT_453102 [Pseudovirgaria hyperparasitica]KAF2757327.1 hypothetical protein EJ05DRAFT_453102 [Pseudovirgaria hyperparasitica]